MERIKLMKKGMRNCPGCGRHCDLSFPGCERGEEFFRTGVMPGLYDRGGRGPHSPGPHHPPHLHGNMLENPRYQSEDLDGKLLAMLRAVGRSCHHMDDKGGQSRVLSVLKDEGEMTQRKLTEQLGIQPGSASEIIGKLERAGMLIRTPSLTDRRTSDISLTEAGAARAEMLSAKGKERRAVMLSALSEEEKTQLLGIMEKLYASWEDQRKDRGRASEA